MSAPAEEAPLEKITRLFRLQKSKSGVKIDAKKTVVEYEWRLRHVTYEVFADILKALNDKKIPVEDAIISQSINVIKSEPNKSSRIDAKPTAQRIQQFTFANGVKTGKEFILKTQLVPPVRVNTEAIPYSVVLSEEATDSLGFIADSNALCRVKLRASFLMRLTEAASATGTAAATATSKSPAPKRTTHVWRIDMTVVRQLIGADAKTRLPPTVDAMFKPPLTARNMLSVLKLDVDSEKRLEYQYECEGEYIGSSPEGAILHPSDVTRSVNEILRAAKPGHAAAAEYQAEVFRAAQIVHVKAPNIARNFESESGLKRLLPQVTALTRTEYRGIFPPVGCLATEKRDGMRALILASGDHCKLLADKLYSFERKERITSKGITVVDAEFIEPNMVDIFDVIVIDGKNVADDGIEVRSTHAEAAAAALKSFGLKAVAKPYVTLTKDNLKESFEKLAADDSGAKKDGIIIVCPGQPYLKTVTYKWKPLEKNTIDFLARRAPKVLLGQTPYIDRPDAEVHMLFVGINPGLYRALALHLCRGHSDLFGVVDTKSSYFPVQFQPSDAPLAYLYWHPKSAPKIDNMIVEMRRVCAPVVGTVTKSITATSSIKSTSVAKNAAITSKSAAMSSKSATAPIKPENRAGFVPWELVRIREDRSGDLASKTYFGNDFRVAELNYLNYIDPFPVEQLWAVTSNAYFAEGKSSIYRAQTGYISFVKSRRIEKMRHFAKIVDLCSGAGADWGRYLDAEVGMVIAVERDRAAAAEMIRRRHSHIIKRKSKGATGRGVELRLILSDVSAPHEETAAKIRDAAGGAEQPADGLVMNLALHYFTGSVESMRNIVALCVDVVKPEGLVCFTTMLGASVHKLFTDKKIAEGKTWDVRTPIEEGDALKYSLKRMYTESTLTAAGQKIGVLLPFSDGAYYEEYLVNTDVIAAEFHKRGFTTVTINSMKDYFNEFEIRNQGGYNELSAADREYISLYGELVFRRKPASAAKK